MSYSKKNIFKALIFAILIPQLIFSLWFFSLDPLFSTDKLWVILIANLMIFLVYCMLVAPIGYAISIWLLKRARLTLLNIMLGALLCLLFLVLLAQVLLPIPLATNSGKLLLTYLLLSAMALFTGLSYWLFLKFLGRRKILNPSESD